MINCGECCSLKLIRYLGSYLFCDEMQGKMENLESDAAHVIRRCFAIHKALGPGLLESVYEETLSAVLINDGFDIKRQLPVRIQFEEIILIETLKLDILVNDSLILELKSIEEIHPVHFKQLLTYLKLSRLPLGLLINFGSPLMKDGIRRVVNNYPAVRAV
jgi:GxxExxY protein